MTCNAGNDRCIARATSPDALSETSECLKSPFLSGSLQNVVGTALLEEATFTQKCWSDPLVDQDRPDDGVLHLRNTAIENVCS